MKYSIHPSFLGGVSGGDWSLSWAPQSPRYGIPWIGTHTDGSHIKTSYFESSEAFALVVDCGSDQCTFEGPSKPKDPHYTVH